MSSFASLRLRTPRLLLRPLVAGDAPALLDIFSDTRTARYLSHPPWERLQQAEELIARDLAAHANGDYLRLGLELEDGTLIGNCTLFGFHPSSRRAEIGYAQSADHWGRGYMREALATLLDFGFGELALNRVEADIDPRNEPSARILERLGFIKEGHLRERWIVAGEVSDTGLYGLLARDWKSRVDAGSSPA